MNLTVFTTVCPKEQQTSDNLIIKDNCFIIEMFDKRSFHSSVIFTVCVKLVPLYHFKPAHVVLRMSVVKMILS